jgi:hypothetical protein
VEPVDRPSGRGYLLPYWGLFRGAIAMAFRAAS